MTRAALAALLFALLAASGAAFAAPDEPAPDRAESAAPGSAPRTPASPPLNTFEIVVGVLGVGAGVGAYLWISRRPPSRGCGSSDYG
ncbi:MAG: hypothetical protein ACOX6T_01245 [Myxococcales bacterium]|jgi:hypothetical protein